VTLFLFVSILLVTVKINNGRELDARKLLNSQLSGLVKPTLSSTPA